MRDCEARLRNKNGVKKKRMSQKAGPWEERRVRDGRNRFRMWIRGLAGDRGPKAAWHLTCFISSSVSFPCHSPPATDATTTRSGKKWQCAAKERNYAEPEASTWGLRVRTDWKVAVLPRIYPYHWCKDDPKSITSQLYVPGRGRGWALTRELRCLIHKEELIGNLKIESTLE